jgi:hypothetical protein
MRFGNNLLSAVVASAALLTAGLSVTVHAQRGGAYEVAETFSFRRSLVLGLAREDSSGAPVLAVLMETGLSEFALSLTVTSDGAVSMYYSNGVARIGLGEHDLVREIGNAYLEHAASFVSRATAAESFPLPERDHVRFYIVTPGGTVTAEALESDLGFNRHEFSRLFHHGHAVISAIRISLGEDDSQTVDYAAARAALAASEDYQPYRYTIVQPRLLAEYRRLLQDPQSTLDQINAPLRELLDDYPLSIQGNYALSEYLRFVAARPQDPAQSSQFIVVSAVYRATADAILASVMESRGGTGLDDAFVVISQVEEHAVMEKMQLRPTTQGLIDVAGVPYDVFDAVDESGVTRKVYFDISKFLPRAP